MLGMSNGSCECACVVHTHAYIYIYIYIYIIIYVGRVHAGAYLIKIGSACSHVVRCLADNTNTNTSTNMI